MTESDLQLARLRYALELQRLHGIKPGVQLQPLRPKAHAANVRGTKDKRYQSRY